MPRPYRTVALAGLFVAAPAFAQSTASDAALRPRSADRLPTAVETPALDANAADPLTPEQLALRLARLYDRQAELLRAEAAHDQSRYVELLDALVADARVLSDAPGVRQVPRFREAYAVVMTEFEQYYDEPALDRGEIYAFRSALFAATDEVDGPLLEDVNLPFDGGNMPVATVFPMTVNRAVEGSIRYLQRSDGHTSRLRSRADTYFPMIERIFQEEGVPEELKYLAMVESALNPRARSYAAAAGLWQFIRATGAAYDLRVNDDRDDRLDPERSTRAAARHLRDLYDRFGDWQLALAGYNCNPARIDRELRAAETRLGRPATFWDIYDHIPRETRNYVPMFIATALVISNPEAYDLPRSYEAGPRYAYDEVPVAGGTSLAVVARAADTDVETLRALNPSLRRERVPGDDEDPWMLRVPVGAYGRFTAELDRLAPDDGVSAQFAAHTVRYGPPSEVVIAPNAGTEALVAGRTPRGGSNARLDAAARNLSEERGGRSNSRRSEPATPPPAVSAPPPSAGPSVAETVAAEPPPVVAAADRREEPAARETPRREERRASNRRETPRREPARPTTHRVQRGDNLTEIAQRYGVTVRQLQQWNELESGTIRPGQRLRVSADAAGARAAANRATTNRPRTTTHTVASGENLTGIARRYGVTVSQVREWNNLSSSTIRPGQRLRIERARG